MQKIARKPLTLVNGLMAQIIWLFLHPKNALFRNRLFSNLAL